MTAVPSSLSFARLSSLGTKCAVRPISNLSSDLIPSSACRLMDDLKGKSESIMGGKCDRPETHDFDDMRLSKDADMAGITSFVGDWIK